MNISGPMTASCSHDCTGCPVGESSVGTVVPAGRSRPSGRVAVGAACIFLAPLFAAAAGGWLGRSVTGLQAPGAVAGLVLGMAGVRWGLAMAGAAGGAS